MKEEKKGRMTLTLLLSGSVFLVTLVTLGIIGIVLLAADKLGLLSRWMEHASILSFFGIIALISLIGGTLLTVFLGTFPLRSINRMTEGLHRLASGDYKARIVPGKILGSIRPIREMIDSFNTTAQELEGTEMLRSDFINNFSHEFKTPIVSIAGFAGLLKQGNLDEQEQKEYLNIIESESRRLAYMATNVLNLTKVENQTILTDVSVFNLSEQLRTCVLLLEAKWEQKNLEMNLELEEHTISGNQELLRQVWVNLLDNAIKFSPSPWKFPLPRRNPALPYPSRIPAPISPRSSRAPSFGNSTRRITPTIPKATASVLPWSSGWWSSTAAASG